MNRLLTPEHLHVALNHLPLVGLAASLIPLVYGLVRKNAEVLVIALAMGVVFGGSTIAVMWTGEGAEERFEHASMVTPLDAAGKSMMKVHEDHAKIASVVSYLPVAACLVSLVIGRWRPQYRYLSGWAVCIVLMITISLMIWVADSGGQIRHPEFRSGLATESFLNQTEMTKHD
jgi:TctA family transporter